MDIVHHSMWETELEQHLEIYEARSCHGNIRVTGGSLSSMGGKRKKEAAKAEPLGAASVPSL